MSDEKPEVKELAEIVSRFNALKAKTQEIQEQLLRQKETQGLQLLVSTTDSLIRLKTLESVTTSGTLNKKVDQDLEQVLDIYSRLLEGYFPKPI